MASDTVAAKQGKWRAIFLTAVILSAFGPSLWPSHGIRLDHLVVYSLSPWAAMYVLCQLWDFGPARFTLWCHVSLLAWTAGATVIADRAVSEIRMVSYAENYCMPVAAALVMMAIVRLCFPRAPRGAFNVASAVVIWGMATNAVLAYLDFAFKFSRFYGPFYFTPLDPGEVSVADLARTMERYTGILGQPAEAGIAYSLAMLCWAYKVRYFGRIKAWDGLAFILVIAGGVLTSSKIFALVGLPLALMLFCLGDPRSRRLKKSFLPGLVVATILTFLGVQLLREWKGYEHNLAPLAERSNYTSDVSFTLTAGRLGSDGYTHQLFELVYTDSPATGWGFGSVLLLDSAYSEVFVQGGAVALLLYCILLCYNLRYPFVTGRAHDLDGRFYLSLFLLVACAGIGVGVFTSNRVPVLLASVLVPLSVLVGGRPCAGCRQKAWSRLHSRSAR